VEKRRERPPNAKSPSISQFEPNMGGPGSNDDNTHQQSLPLKMEELPTFIKELPRTFIRLSELVPTTREALSIPSDALRDELIDKYIQFVHPLAPITLIGDLLDCIEAGAEARKVISLLLFQAIMFAGSAFASTEILAREGYRSRMAARRTLFTRARASFPRPMFCIRGSC
jgi:hypothetical protein